MVVLCWLLCMLDGGSDHMEIRGKDFWYIHTYMSIVLFIDDFFRVCVYVCMYVID